MKARDFLTKARDVIYPPALYCISCGAIVDETRTFGLCDSCVRRFDWVGTKTCAKCGKVLPTDPLHAYCHDCLAFEPAFDRGFTCTSYGLYERMLVGDYKEKGKTYLSQNLADMMAERWLREQIWVDDVCFVPSSPSKVKSRGFDQMALVAERFCERLGRPLAANVLEKTKDTPSMRKLSREERHQNVQGIYRVRPGREERVRGKTWLLLDDVYTTGSTLDACARALKEAGSADVYVLTFAAGGDYRPQEEGIDEKNRPENPGADEENRPMGRGN